MKKHILLIMFLFGFIFQMNAQTVYTMNSHGQGAGEFIDNFKNADPAKDIWGIRFSAGSKTRGFVNNEGRWGFFSPNNSHYIATPSAFNDLINTKQDLTFGVEGMIYTEALTVSKLNLNTLNTLELYTSGTSSSISSHGDSDGLHIQSHVGGKIYMYDQVYFDERYWASMGAGRNDDPTINNNNDKMMRIGSNGGIGLWGSPGVNDNDTPHLFVSGQSVRTTVPLLVTDNTSKIQLYLGTSDDNRDAWIGTNSANGMYLGANNNFAMYIGSDNNMYIGLGNSEAKNIRPELRNKYRIFVSKGILSEDYSVAPKASWSDFVFQKDYVLPTISEVEKFIDKNSHLPDVPSAEQIAEDGYSQHDMNKILLQKIEELTLYTIQQQKEISALKTELNGLKKQK